MIKALISSSLISILFSFELAYSDEANEFLDDLLSFPVPTASGPMPLSEIFGESEREAILSALGETLLSCTNAPTWLTALQDLQPVLLGLASFASNKLVIDGLLKNGSDYPNVCHILSEKMMDLQETDKPIDKDYPFGVGGDTAKLVGKMQMYIPEYSYWLPKYFVEVSTKGNDPHPAFAEGNQMYRLNRKIADAISGAFSALDGPVLLSSTMAVGSAVATTAAKGAAVMLSKMSPGGQYPNAKSDDFTFDWSQLVDSIGVTTKSTAMVPFQKLRIRANKRTNGQLGSYESNIWPVGLSKSYVEFLSPCGDGDPTTSVDGGIGIPIPGVDPICPISMSRDLWYVWDTGLLDLIDIKEGAAQTVPGACHVTDTFTVQQSICKNKNDSDSSNDSDDCERNTISDSDLSNKVDSILKETNKYMSLVRFCSLPLFGAPSALMSKIFALGASLTKPPQCTGWGPLVPRASTPHLDNEFVMVNQAYKYKSLSHDVHFSPRGNNEMWSLAYPWEAQTESTLENIKDWFKDQIVEFGSTLRIPESYTNKIVSKIDSSADMVKSGRSIERYPIGSINLSDLSWQGFYDEFLNIVKEMAYIAAYSSAPGVIEKIKEAINHLRRKFNEMINSATGNAFVIGRNKLPSGASEDLNVITPDEVLQKNKKEKEAVDRSAVKLKHERVYDFSKLTTYCAMFRAIDRNSKIYKSRFGATIDYNNDREFHIPPMFSDVGLSNDEIFEGSKGGLLYLKRKSDNSKCDLQLFTNSARGYLKNAKTMKGRSWHYFVEISAPEYTTRLSDTPVIYEETLNCLKSYPDIDINLRGHSVKILDCKMTVEKLAVDDLDYDKKADPDPDNPSSEIYEKTFTEDGDVKKSAGDKAELDQALDGLKSIDAAKLVSFVGAEIARAKYEEYTGRSFLPGKKRVYTIWENIKCTPDHNSPKDQDNKYMIIDPSKAIPGLPKRWKGKIWASCGKALRNTMRKLLSTKLFRPICEAVLGDQLGEPFK